MTDEELRAQFENLHGKIANLAAFQQARDVKARAFSMRLGRVEHTVNAVAVSAGLEDVPTTGGGTRTAFPALAKE